MQPANKSKGSFWDSGIQPTPVVIAVSPSPQGTTRLFSFSFFHSRFSAICTFSFRDRRPLAVSLAVYNHYESKTLLFLTIFTLFRSVLFFGNDKYYLLP